MVLSGVQMAMIDPVARSAKTFLHNGGDMMHYFLVKPAPPPHSCTLHTRAFERSPRLQVFNEELSFTQPALGMLPA